MCQCFWGSSEAKISTQGHCWSYSNSLNSYFHSYTFETTYLAVYYRLIEDTYQVFVFSWKIKMSNLLHVGLILIISKVFIILCLLCLCRNIEYRGNFQNKTVISKQLFCQMSAQVKWKGRPFWDEQEAWIYSLNYLLNKGQC